MIDTEKIFTNHPPFGDQIDRYQKIRQKAKEFADLIIDSSSSSAEQTLAIRSIQSAVFYANASIAIYEEPPITINRFSGDPIEMSLKDLEALPFYDESHLSPGMFKLLYSNTGGGKYKAMSVIMQGNNAHVTEQRINVVD